ncbi:MAG TPA: hypothetical protein VFP92_11605 [Rhodanobacteraceae bacterium]|nr:hypothetical protein [Rhodanobacteraceae bacterium]
MNVDKARILRTRHPGSDPECGLDGQPEDVDRESVLDLLALIEDERRFHAAAALVVRDPVERDRYRAMTREDTALLANIRHGLASVTRRHLSRHQRARQLAVYARRLMARSQLAGRYPLSSTTNLQRGGP